VMVTVAATPPARLHRHRLHRHRRARRGRRHAGATHDAVGGASGRGYRATRR